jgi:hypothetical protein
MRVMVRAALLAWKIGRAKLYRTARGIFNGIDHSTDAGTAHQR